MKPLRLIDSSLSLKILFITGVILVTTITITFYVIGKRQERLLFGQVELQARILFGQILLTRRWIADHGGIFVEKLPWVKKNQYLPDSEITDTGGKRYIKENPAFVTRELSEYSKREGLYWFHITSLRLINPANAPDDFERKALEIFERREAGELTRIEDYEGLRHFRYIAPLFIESSCLRCHPDYRIGDVRGAISITLPVDSLFLDVYANKRYMILGTIFISTLLLGALFISMRAYIIKPIGRLKDIIEAYSGGDKPDFTITSTDEVGSIYRAFSDMRDILDQHQNLLREKINDATREVQKTNEKLMEANRLYMDLNNRKSEFISIISHELRTPLTSIKGAIDYINMRLTRLKDDSIGFDISDILRFLEVIGLNAERLVRMVNETLDLEKIESGRMEFHFTELELSYAINDIIWELVPILNDKKVKLRTDIKSGLYVCADEDRIREVIVNILSNAIQYSPERSGITVEGHPAGDWVEVRISDEGTGIAPDEQGRVFEKFYKGKHGGTGLGLALCKSIIEAHNGEIGVISDGGRGSLFYFRLPSIKVGDGKQDTCCR